MQRSWKTRSRPCVMPDLAAWVRAACLWIVLILSAPFAHATEVVLDQARLVRSDFAGPVTLPHVVAKKATDHDGTTFTYVLDFDLPAEPGVNWAIYVPKLSVWGDAWLNGAPIGPCAPGRAEMTRCLHQPAFWFPDRSLWRPGKNRIVFHIWGDDRQMVGLSQVVVAPAEEIYATHFKRAAILRQGTLGLIWANAIIGLFALIVAARLPNEPNCLYFGLAALGNAAASTNLVLVHNPFTPEFLSWFIFASRYASMALMLLLMMSGFDLLHRHRHRRTAMVLWGVAIAGPALIWLSGNSRETVILAYLALAILGPFVAVLCAWQLFRAPSRFRMVLLGGLILLCGAAASDYLRLAGGVAFVGTYVLGYAFTVLILAFGGLIFARFAQGVMVARKFNQELEAQVAARTSQLSDALHTIRNLETSALHLTENIPIGTFVLRDDGSGWMVFDFLSGRMRQMLGIAPDEAIPALRDLVDRVDPAHRDGLVAALKATLRTGEDFEWSGQTAPSAGGRWIGIKALANKSGYALKSWAGVCTDLTDVRAAEERLRQANAALLEQAVEESRAQERELLLQEMHDGFGSQLASARIAVKSGKLAPEDVERILEECTIDLQLVVDAAGNADGSFADMLADFQDRTRQRLAGVPIDLKWDIDLSAAMPDLSPATSLRLLRILQEALNNALRHSGGKTLRVQVTITTAPNGTTLILRVEDDGVGLTEDVAPRRGFANMHRRSREIGAQLDLHRLTPGLCVELRLDIPCHA